MCKHTVVTISIFLIISTAVHCYKVHDNDSALETELHDKDEHEESSSELENSWSKLFSLADMEELDDFATTFANMFSKTLAEKINKASNSSVLPRELVGVSIYKSMFSLFGSEEKTSTTTESYAKPTTDSYTKPTSESYTKPTTESYPKPTTESYTKPTTESYTKPTTESYPKPTTESYPKSTTKGYPKPTTESYSKPTTKSYPKPTTESYTTPTTESYTKPTTERYPKPTTESYTKPTTESYQKPTTESYTKPTTESYPKPSTDSYTTPTTESYTKPTTESYPKPTTESYMKPATESYPKPSTDSYTTPSTESYTTSTTESYPKPTTESYMKPATESYVKPTIESYKKTTSESYTNPTTESYTKPTTESYTIPTTESYGKPTTESYTTTAVACKSPMLDYATVILAGCDSHNVFQKAEVWSKVKDINIPNSPIKSCEKPASVFFQNSIVMCGGDATEYTECFQYELGTYSWKPFLKLPIHKERFTMAATETSIVLVGGFKSHGSIDIFTDGHWDQGLLLPETDDIIHHCSVSYEDKVLVLGGMEPTGPTDKVHVIDVTHREVKAGPSLSSPRHQHSCTRAQLHGSQVVVVAGGFNKYEVTNTVEYLDVCNDGYQAWVSLKEMNIRRYDFGLTIYGNQIAAFGGEPTIESQMIEVFNEDKDCWEFTGEVLEAEDKHYFTAVSVPTETIHGY